MKKLFLLVVAYAATQVSYAQDIQMDGDTLRYQNKTFYVGKKVKLGYGSSVSKDFAFVHFGSGMGEVQKMAATNTKNKLVIDKNSKNQGKYYFRGKVVDMPKFISGTMKAFVDVEGAVDFKELVLQ